MPSQKNNTRKMRGGNKVKNAVGKLATLLTRSRPTTFLAKSHPSFAAPRLMSTVVKPGKALSSAPFEEVKGDDKVYRILLSKKDFPTQGITEGMVRRINPLSYKSVWQKLFGESSAPQNKITREQYIDAVLKRLRKEGRLVEDKPSTATAADIKAETTKILSEVLNASPEVKAAYAAAGTDFFKVNRPDKQVKEDIGDLSNEITAQEQSGKPALNVAGTNKIDPGVLQEALEATVLRPKYNEAALKRGDISEIINHPTVRQLVFRLGRLPGARFVPGLARSSVYRSVFLPQSLMISGKDLAQFRVKDPMYEPTIKGWTELNAEIFNIINYLLKYDTRFDVKQYFKVFTPDRVFDLKLGIINYYVYHGKEKAKAVLDLVLRVLRTNAFTEDSIDNVIFLLQTDPNQAVIRLKDILEKSAAHSLTLKQAASEAEARGFGWFTGKAKVGALLALGVGGFLFFLQYHGVDTGSEIIQSLVNKVNRMIFLLEIDPDFKDIKKKAEVEKEIVGKAVTGEVLKPVFERAAVLGTPIESVVSDAKEAYSQFTAPYRPVPITTQIRQDLDWLLGRAPTMPQVAPTAPSYPPLPPSPPSSP